MPWTTSALPPWPRLRSRTRPPLRDRGPHTHCRPGAVLAASRRFRTPARRPARRPPSRSSSRTSRTPGSSLDGQTAVLDDSLLEVRPEGRRHAAAASPPAAASPSGPVDDPHGRVHGLRRDRRKRDPAARHGAGDRAGRAPCPSGYLPDMFGLRRLGLPQHRSARPASSLRGGLAVVCRPRSRDRALVGSTLTDPGSAPSTCTARTPTGCDLPDDAKQLVAAFHTATSSSLRRRLPARGRAPAPRRTAPTTRRPAAAGSAAAGRPRPTAVQDDYRFVVTSLPEYLARDQRPGSAHDLDRRAAVRRERTCSWACASNRVDVHQVRGGRAPSSVAARSR